MLSTVKHSDNDTPPSTFAENGHSEIIKTTTLEAFHGDRPHGWFHVKEKSEDDSTVYRGISSRRFERKFTMADDIVVNSAKLENGMLSLELERVVPEEKKPRLVAIK